MSEEHGSSSSAAHRKAAATRGPVAVAIVTVSDTRTELTDKNGPYLREQLAAAGHTLAGYRLINDDPARVVAALEELAAGDAQVILFNGGTGVTARDNTYDALATRLEKILPGFGELFRMLSWEQIGAAAMLSRAIAGTYRGTVVVSTPGSSAAVRLAWEQLIGPELAHLAWEVGR